MYFQGSGSQVTYAKSRETLSTFCTSRVVAAKKNMQNHTSPQALFVLPRYWQPSNISKIIRVPRHCLYFHGIGRQATYAKSYEPQSTFCQVHYAKSHESPSTSCTSRVVAAKQNMQNHTSPQAFLGLPTCWQPSKICKINTSPHALFVIPRFGSQAKYAKSYGSPSTFCTL